MRADLLLTTQNRHAELRRLLDSLCRQQTAAFRLIAGIQDADDAMRDLLAAYADRLTIEIVPLPRCSLSHARNRLLPYLRNEIFALTDDDCVYAPDTVSRCLAFFAAHPDVSACVGTPVELAGAKGADEGRQAGAPGSARVISRTGAFRAAPSYVLFFRRSVAGQVGLFDEQLGVGAATPWQSGEETDYLLRCMDRGGKVMRVPEIRVAHPAPAFCPEKAGKWYAYGRGRMRVLHSHHFSLPVRLLHVVQPLLRLPGAPFRNWPGLASMFKGRLDGLFRP